MKKLLLVGCIGLLASVLWAAFVPPIEGDVYLTITRVTTSETRSLDFLPDTDGGWDLGDTTNTITENYGGEPFSNGVPLQLEVYITQPPTNDAWDAISLQYIAGTNSGASTNWTTIKTISSGFDSVTNVLGCHFGLTWTPPVATRYLVRIHGITTGGLENASMNASNITAKGDGLTWDNHEVLGFTLTDNTRPGFRVD
jgi:hypothetical protein